MRSSRGTIFKRREYILEQLQKEGYVNVSKLATDLNVSPLTIRRDLEMFEKKKMIVKTYGGASFIHGKHIEYTNEIPNFEIEDEKIDQTNRLVKAAMKYMPLEGTVFINSGFISSELMLRNNDPALQIVTNTTLSFSLPFQQRNIIFTGGELNDTHNAFVGDGALHSLQFYEATVCFIESEGISKRLITSHSLSESIVDRHMIENTLGNRIFICKGKDIGHEHNFMTDFTTIATHIITDTQADAEVIQELQSLGIIVEIV